jgi:hypothetical protein
VLLFIPNPFWLTPNYDLKTGKSRAIEKYRIFPFFEKGFIRISIMRVDCFLSFAISLYNTDLENSTEPGARAGQGQDPSRSSRWI